MAVFTESRRVFCSQQTQTTFITGTISTQCALRLLISSSSQTYDECSVVDYTQAGASSVGFPASHDGTDITAEAGHHSCSCHPPSDNTGSFSSDSNGSQFGEKLYSCHSCQQHNHRTAFLEVCSSDKMLYICSVCKKVFRKKYHLISHERVHTGERPYKCNFCQKAFFQKGHLGDHEALHSSLRPYVCCTCQKSFAKRSNLVYHERVHSGEKPYVCSTCQKSFARRGDLVCHERLHSGERPYACSTCQKSFARRSDMVRHERSHSGEKSNVCSISQKSFARRSNLVCHERSHSGKKSHV